MHRSASRHTGRRVLWSLLCAALAFAVGCSHRAAETINQREYASYRTAGTASIAGQVTMTLPSGQVLYGSACQVRLTPITSESTRYIQEVAMTGGSKNWKQDADAVWWLAQANDEGRFHFEAVPAGSYYVTCPVAWRDAASGDTRQRILWAETTVGARESVSVAVSR